MAEVRLLQGNEACALGALYAGCRFFAGYPISPSSEIAELMAARLPAVGGVFIQMEDEIASVAAAIGASLAGRKAMTATSGPGFSLMQENIGFAVMAEVPLVVVDVMRVGPSTGMPTSPSQGDVMQARWGTHGDHPAVAFAPSNVADIFRFTVEAFNVAEELRTPVILLLDEAVAHMREKVALPSPGEVPVRERAVFRGRPEEAKPYQAGPDGVPPFVPLGEGYGVHVTGLYHDEEGFPTSHPDLAEALIRRLHRKVELRRSSFTFVRREGDAAADLLLVAYGSSARAARRAVRLAEREGIKVELLELITLWPFPREAVREAAEEKKAVLVAELNLGQVAGEVEKVVGTERCIPVNKVHGEIFHPQEIVLALREALAPAARG